MDKRKNDLFKEIKRKNVKKTEDLLLQFLKTVRNTFDSDIWMESLTDEQIMTEDARCGDPTAQFALAMYWLLKSADIEYPAAKKTAGLLYFALTENKDEEIDEQSQKGYVKLCFDTAKYLRDRCLDYEIAEALEIEGSSQMDRCILNNKKETDILEQYVNNVAFSVCDTMAKEYFEKGIELEKLCKGFEKDFMVSTEGQQMIENFKIALELGEERARKHIEKWEKYI